MRQWSETDAEFRARLLGSSPSSVPPRPELYDELVAAGTWPLGISKEQAEDYWRNRRSKPEPT